MLDIENEIRQSPKVFGLMVGPRGLRATFVARVHQLVACVRPIAGVTDFMLRAWEALWAEYKKLHDLLVQMVGRDELCRRFCAIPGVGPVTALTFRAAIDDPHRFSTSKTVGGHFGLTSRRIQTGTSIDIEGHISAADRKGSELWAVETEGLVRSRLKRMLNLHTKAGTCRVGE